jgi:hypothetical protein
MFIIQAVNQRLAAGTLRIQHRTRNTENRDCGVG